MCHNESHLWCLIRVALPPPYFFTGPCSLSRQVTPICPTFLLLHLSIWKINDTQQYLFSFGCTRGTHLLSWLGGKHHTSQEKLLREEDLGQLWETNEKRGRCFCVAVTCSQRFPVQGDSSWPKQTPEEAPPSGWWPEHMAHLSIHSSFLSISPRVPGWPFHCC